MNQNRTTLIELQRLVGHGCGIKVGGFNTKQDTVLWHGHVECGGNIATRHIAVSDTLAGLLEQLVLLARMTLRDLVSPPGANP